MVLKLVLPYIDKRIQGGLIVRWYKSEGEWVGYGDDLFELRLEEIKTIIRPLRPRQIIRSLNNPRTTVGALWRYALLRITSSDNQQRLSGRTKMSERHALLRITSSDMGIMRRIYAKEGMRREVGDLLAVLTTDEKEPFDEASEALKEASLFRVVTNIP